MDLTDLKSTDLTAVRATAIATARDPRRLGPLLIAFAGYGFAGLTVPLFLLFAGDQLLPRTVDVGPAAGTLVAVLIDVGLLVLFGLQHSGMSRPRVKETITRVVPPALERTGFIVMACLAIWVLCLGWRPIPGTVWELSGVAASLAQGGFWLGFVLVYVATLLLNHFHLLGLSQAYRGYVRQVADPTSDRLQVSGPYRLVRHPLMTGLLLCFWCTPTMTKGHLLWAGGLSAYIVLGTVLEERDLIARFGDSYRQYRRMVPAFIPRPTFRGNR